MDATFNTFSRGTGSNLPAFSMLTGEKMGDPLITDHVTVAGQDLNAGPVHQAPHHQAPLPWTLYMPLSAQPAAASPRGSFPGSIFTGSKGATIGASIGAAFSGAAAGIVGGITVGIAGALQVGIPLNSLKKAPAETPEQKEQRLKDELEKMVDGLEDQAGGELEETDEFLEIDGFRLARNKGFTE
jgi:hypothetical protein